MQIFAVLMSLSVTEYSSMLTVMTLLSLSQKGDSVKGAFTEYFNGWLQYVC